MTSELRILYIIYIYYIIYIMYTFIRICLWDDIVGQIYVNMYI